MKTICLVFQVHQPVRLSRYRFFDIGNHLSYYDDHANETILLDMAKTCYLPFNNLLLRQINSQGGRLKVAFYISGTTLDQLEVYATEVYDSFQTLASTGCVEFLSGTNSNSLSSICNEEAFRKQVTDHRAAMVDLTGKTSKVFFNTGLLYDDGLGAKIADMGFKGIFTEGTKQVLGWKSPNTLYTNPFHPSLYVFFRNSLFSEDLVQRFSDESWNEFPVTPQKYLSRILSLGKEDGLINLVIPYEIFGERRNVKNGIFHFLDHFLFLISHSQELQFRSPSEIIASGLPSSVIRIPHPVSWNGDNNSVLEWTTNELQQEALKRLYELSPLMNSVSDPDILRDWKYLQTADHFKYMSTKSLSVDENLPDTPYDSPFDAFINYMNILNDFKIRLRPHS